jgi:glycosyltransferase involved in cell wall biosynthesis
MARIMVLVPYYGFFPPRGGGKLRSFHLLQELSRKHELHAILFQPEKELRQSTDGYRFPEAVKIYGPTQTPPPPTLFDKLPARLGYAFHHRWLQRSWRGPASSILLQTHHLTNQILSKHKIDIAIFTTLSTSPVASLAKRLRPQVIRILNTENVENSLLLQAIQARDDNEDERALLQKEYLRALSAESHLARSFHAFFACSEADREELESLNKGKLKGYLVPNGVDTVARPFDDRPDKNKSREILFCGTLSYPPNRDGLLWFHKEVWPLIVEQHPGIRLVVIGWGTKKEDFDILYSDPTVDLVGEVNDSIPYYHRAGIAVVPLRQGSGTHLKVLDSMSLGNPVISTRIGAQGIDAAHGKHLLLADQPNHFAEAVTHLLSDADMFERIRRSARLFVEQKYDWKVIGQKMNDSISSLLTRRA